MGITIYDTDWRLPFSEDEPINELTVDEDYYAKSAGAKRSQNVYKLTEMSNRTLFIMG